MRLGPDDLDQNTIWNCTRYSFVTNFMFIPAEHKESDFDCPISLNLQYRSSGL